MRNTRSKLTDRLELLRLSQRFFRALPLRDLRGQLFVCGGEAAGSFSHEPFEVLPTTRQGLARLDDVGYVGAGAEPSDDPAVIANRRGARLEPAILAVSSTNPELRVVLVLPFYRPNPALPAPLSILALDDLVEPGEPELLFLRNAGV